MERKQEAAFPATSNGICIQKGMTLRDWFAGQALANTAYVDSKDCSDNAAKYAYDVADSMMNVREVTK